MAETSAIDSTSERVRAALRTLQPAALDAGLERALERPVLGRDAELRRDQPLAHRRGRLDELVDDLPQHLLGLRIGGVDLALVDDLGLEQRSVLAQPGGEPQRLDELGAAVPELAAREREPALEPKPPPSSSSSCSDLPRLASISWVSACWIQARPSSRRSA